MDNKEKAIAEIEEMCDNFMKDFGEAVKKLRNKEYNGAVKKIKKD